MSGFIGSVQEAGDYGYDAGVRGFVDGGEFWVSG